MTDTPKHTPGPWMSPDPLVGQIISRNGDYVALVWNVENQPIIAAASELYAAPSLISSLAWDVMAYNDPEDQEEMAAVIAQARAALAKAGGRE